LIVVKDFSWESFFLATAGAVLGITALSAAFSAYLLRPLGLAARAALVAAALLLVAPEFYSTAIGVSLLAAVMLWQVARRPLTCSTRSRPAVAKGPDIAAGRRAG